MARLTYKNPDGTWGLNNGYDMHKVPSELYGALWKLKDYEETGLKPDEIEAYKELGYSFEQIRDLLEYLKKNNGDIDKILELKQLEEQTPEEMMR